MESVVYRGHPCLVKCMCGCVVYWKAGDGFHCLGCEDPGKRLKPQIESWGKAWVLYAAE